MQNYYTLATESVSEIEIKKSKFIGYIKGTATEEEAMAYIAEIKKMHREATHHCTAIRIAGRVPLERYDDDGEPSKTAGPPMLSVLQGKELWNVTAVVVRYFGGTLLGPGGLIRAYSESVRETLDANTIVYRQLFSVLELEVSYALNDKIAYELEKDEIAIGEKKYAESVRYELMIEKENRESFMEKYRQLSEAKGKITELREEYGYYFDGKLVTGKE